MTARRVAVGLLVAIAGIGSIFWAPLFALLLTLVAIVGSVEFAALAKRAGAGLSLPVALGGCTAYMALAFFQQMYRYEHGLLAMIIVGAIVLGLATGFDHFGARVGWTVVATLYLGKLLSYLVVLRQLPNGERIVLWTVVIVVLTDTVGMAVGLRYGRAKLWAQLSPAKTWEGAIAAFAVACGVGTITGTSLLVGVPWGFALAFSAIVSLAAQLGDLVESAFKRDARVKDSGEFLGEHGGMLDRFDSYVLVGAAAYVTLLWSGHL